MKYKILMPLLFIVFITTYTPVQCQIIIDSLKSKEDYIINATVYKKGIYKSFVEFKYNNPSSTEEFFFNDNKLWRMSGKKKEILHPREYWGFCDGEKVYVRWNKNYELLEKGRYCYFVAKEVNIIPVVSGGVPLPVPIPDKDALIINFNNGKTFELGKKFLEKIFEIDDLELLEMYKSENNRGKKYLEYIVLYNQRNKDKVR